MIASLSGRVASVGADVVVVEVGGVGLQVSCPPQTALALRPGEEVTLATHLVVREDSLTLFGFADAESRDLFEVVQTVSGIGPRIAAAMLSALSPEDIRRAIAQEDLATLVRVPGIGRKGAQRLVLELRDRLPAPSGGVADGQRGGASWRDSVQAGLESLGWSSREAEAAIGQIEPLARDQEADGGGIDVAALLRAALRSLDRA